MASLDVNGDGTLDVRDMSLLLRAILDGKEAKYVTVADMNGDGQIDVRDLSLMLMKILN